MVEITNIPFEDFPENDSRAFSKAEWNAVRRLAPGEAIKFPCRWAHSVSGIGNRHNQCVARARVRRIGKELGRDFEASCVDKVLYVRRLKGIEKGDD